MQISFYTDDVYFNGTPTPKLFVPTALIKQKEDTCSTGTCSGSDFLFTSIGTSKIL